MKTLKILKVEYISGHSLKLNFSDGKEQVVDFESFLKNSQHSEIRKYLDTKAFKRFKLRDGEIMWGDFDLIFPIMDLYNNEIEHNAKPSPTRKRSFSSTLR